MATQVPDPLQPLNDKLDEIISNQAASKAASDELIADIQKLLQTPTTTGQVAVSQATLTAMLAKAQSISDGLVAETTAEKTEDQAVNPPATPAAPGPTVTGTNQ